MPDSVPSLRAVPSVPRLDEVVMDSFDERRKQDELLIELDALNAASLATEHKEGSDEARRLVMQALRTRERVTPLDIEEQVIPVAMARIVGSPVASFTDFPPATDATEWEHVVSRTVVRAWVAWVQGIPEVASSEIARLRARQQNEEHIDARSGAVNLMALYLWAGAVEALARGERPESFRLWKRAIEVVTSFGADASLLVQWTFAATFFPVH